MHRKLRVFLEYVGLNYFKILLRLWNVREQWKFVLVVLSARVSRSAPVSSACLNANANTKMMQFLLCME